MASRGTSSGASGVLDGAALARAYGRGRRPRGANPLGGWLCAELPAGLQAGALRVQLLLLALLLAAVGYGFLASSRLTREATPVLAGERTPTAPGRHASIQEHSAPCSEPTPRIEYLCSEPGPVV